MADLRNESPTATSIVDVLRSRAEAQPERTAYIWLRDGEEAGAELSYGELDRRARSIAARLQQCTKPEDRALLLYPPGLDFVAAFFGVLYAGAINVPTYPPQVTRRNQTLERVQTIARETAPVVMTSARIFSSRDNIIAAAPEMADLHWLDTEAIDSAMSSRWTRPDIVDSTLALLQFTSGSTGVPKGTMISHGNLMSNLATIHGAFSHDAGSYGVSWLPPYHDMGLIGGVLQPVFGGFPVVLMSPISFLQHPVRWLRAISRFEATSSGGPNFAYELCLRRITAEHRAGLDLSCWRAAFNGAEPVRPDTMARFASTFAACGFRRKAFYPCYGLAEATLMVSGGEALQGPTVRSVRKTALARGRVVDGPADDHDVQQLAGSGVLRPGFRVAIVDPESCAPCPPDRVGEIWISGPAVAQGYWHRPEETLQSFGACRAGTGEGPYFRTGDLGFLRGRELFVTGRLKDLVIVNGRNHYPPDIEQTVEQSDPSFQPNSCAVFSVDIGHQERVVVLVETAGEAGRGRPGVPSEARADPGTERTRLTRLIRRNVAEAHDLQVYDVRFLKPGSIPKTTSGKIRRHLCRSAFLDGQF